MKNNTYSVVLCLKQSDTLAKRERKRKIEIAVSNHVTIPTVDYRKTTVIVKVMGFLLTPPKKQNKTCGIRRETNNQGAH